MWYYNVLLNLPHNLCSESVINSYEFYHLDKLLEVT